MVKGLIFDFDGLLVDTEVIWFEIYHSWLSQEYNYELEKELFVMCVGSTSDKMFLQIGEIIGQVIDIEKFERDCIPVFKERTQNMDLLPGAKSLIRSAHKKGIRLALATSSVRERPLRILKEHNILDCFSSIVTRDDVHEVKPDPELFNRALDSLNLEPEEVIIFEDSWNGLIAGNRAGIRVVVIPNEITKLVNFQNYYQKFVSLEVINLDSL